MLVDVTGAGQTSTSASGATATGNFSVLNTSPASVDDDKRRGYMVRRPRTVADYELLGLLSDAENDLDLLWCIWLDMLASSRIRGASQFLTLDKSFQQEQIAQLRGRATRITEWRESYADTRASTSEPFKYVQWLFPAHKTRPYLRIPLKDLLHPLRFHAVKKEAIRALEVFRTMLRVPGRVEECDVLLDCSDLSPHALLLSSLSKALFDVVYYHPAMIRSCKALREPKLIKIWALMGKQLAPCTLHFEGETDLGDLISMDDWQKKYMKTSEESVPFILDIDPSMLAMCCRNSTGGFSMALKSGGENLNLTADQMKQLKRTGLLYPFLASQNAQGVETVRAPEKVGSDEMHIIKNLGSYPIEFYGADPTRPATRQQARRGRAYSLNQRSAERSYFSTRRAWSESRCRSLVDKGFRASSMHSRHDVITRLASSVKSHESTISLKSSICRSSASRKRSDVTHEAQSPCERSAVSETIPKLHSEPEVRGGIVVCERSVDRRRYSRKKTNTTAAEGATPGTEPVALPSPEIVLENPVEDPVASSSNTFCGRWLGWGCMPK